MLPPPSPARNRTLTTPQTRTASLLAPLPLAGLALRSATPAAFPTPRPTPAASPLSSPPLGPTTTALPAPTTNAPASTPADADVSALVLDASEEALAPPAGGDRAQTVFGAPRRAPPALAALARTVAGALPSVRWVALAPAGPAEGAGEGGDMEDGVDSERAACQWFEVGSAEVARPRCLGREETVLVRRRLEGLGRWD